MQTFSPRTLRKLKELIRAADSERDNPSVEPVTISPQTAYVAITGAINGDGYYPATVSLWDSTAEAWVDFGDVWAIPAIDSFELTDTKSYLGIRFADLDIGGDVRPVFVVAGSLSASDLIDLSGRSGSIADVTALQILRGVISGTAGAAVFTPDDASASLPGDVNLSAQYLGNGQKSADKFGFGTSTHTDSGLNIYASDSGDFVQILRASGAAFTTQIGPVIRFARNPEEPGTADEYVDINATANGLLQINDVDSLGASQILAYILRDVTGSSFSVSSTDGGIIGPGKVIAGVKFAVGLTEAGLANGVTGSGCNVSSTGGIVTAIDSVLSATNAGISGSVAFTGDISPAQLTANTNDWAPTGW